MDTGTLYGLMDIVILGCGLYILYAYYLLMARHEIKTGVLISQKVNPQKCKDFEGYRKYISPKVLALGVTAVISGGIGLYQDYVAPVNYYLYVGFFILFFVVLVWFVVSIRKAEKLFW